MLAKFKLYSIKALISKALINSNISHGEFFLIKNVLKKYNDMKKEIKFLKMKQFIKDFSLFIKQYYVIV